jgi:hypothetical protein
MRLARCVANKKKEYDALEKKKKPKDTHVDAGDVDERPM